MSADSRSRDIPATLSRLPFFLAERFTSPTLIGVCRADQIHYTSAATLLETVREIGIGLAALGVEPGARVAILAESRPDWLIADLAILTSAAVSVPIYPTLSSVQIEALLADSSASVLIVSGPEQLAKVTPVLPRLPALKAVVLFDGPVAPAAVPVRVMADVAIDGRRLLASDPRHAEQFRARADAVVPTDLATIIYTSGSSGEPKGVMLTHANIIANLRDVQQVLTLTDADVALSYLPLCHAFERTTAFVYLTHGVSLVFAETIDTMARDLMTVRPTIMSGVPRVYEKLLDRILERGRAETGIRRQIFELAMGVARERGRTIPDGQPMAWWAHLVWPVVNRMVFQTIRGRLGGRLRFTVSGSAPLREEVGRLFFGIGLPIAEGYGLTETSPVLTVNPPTALRFGTVGKPLPSVQLRIAADGEILAKGPNIMTGYYRRPDLTAEVLQDGWFATGDIGHIDADGNLRITDRKKELLVTSGGKKVAPQPLEAALRGHALISEAVVVGDGQRFPAALLLPRWRALAEAVGQSAPTSAEARSELAARPDVRAALQEAINAINAPRAQFERMKAFAVIVEDFSVLGGELTPTLKVKRRVIEARYASMITAMYQSPTGV